MAVDTVNEKIPPYRVAHFEEIKLSQMLPVLQNKYPEITEIVVDHNQFVTLQGLDNEDNDVNGYINPLTGEILGKPQKKSEFIQWITSLHRSLFLHETGRIIVGIVAFLLLLIAISGTALLLQRQKGLRRFFSKIVKDYFAQYYHVVAGRFLLLPILIIALSGTYLSMERLKFFPENKQKHSLNFNNSEDSPKQSKVSEFPIFNRILLDDLVKIEFPFDDDPEEFYTIKLKDSELIVNQFTGEIVSEIRNTATENFAILSLDLHTGRANSVWAIILGIASLNILFFIYSGFAMTLKRRSVRIKNKFKASESEIILLVGSENGSSLRFANAIHKQLLAHGQISHLTELNKYAVFLKAKHLVVLTSTHGLGDPPSNAKKFEFLLANHSQEQEINVAVVGFGSQVYPDFCGYAKKVDFLISQQKWSNSFLELHTVDDKSVHQFAHWVKSWSEKIQIPLATTPAIYNEKPADLQKMMVLEKTSVGENDLTFIITLRAPSRAKFDSGDLLAIYPLDDALERLYSIGKIDGNIQLVVKLHPSGLGSGFLNELVSGSMLKAKIIRNNSFHFPKKGKKVALIANGTGIAPFLGMIANNKKNETSLYCGFRRETEIVNGYKKSLAKFIESKRLKSFNIAFSREENPMYVMDLIQKDAVYFTNLLQQNGIVMICGSIAMQKDVEKVMNEICSSNLGRDVHYFKANGQLLTDCY